MSPLIYGNVYATTAPRGKPGYVMYTVAAIVAVAEALHLSLTDAQCRPGAPKHTQSSENGHDKDAQNGHTRSKVE